ncbi:hypothetical protein AB0F88_37455 [Streptosporangium sp. NPDC023963]|uniref:hypothetical protein n=1 Tax=Streptosporangium sp. NPDC023963 TaxID=3155608 RepID=UPI003432428B
MIIRLKLPQVESQTLNRSPLSLPITSRPEVARKVVADVGDHPYAVDAAERATELLTILQLPAHDVRRGAYLDEPSAHQIAHRGLSRRMRLPTS